MRNPENRRIKLYRGSWYVVWREGTGAKRVSLRTKDRGQAERNFQEFLRQSVKNAQTVAQVLDLWEMEKSHLKSINIAKSKAKPIRQFFGNLHPDQITKSLCRDYTIKRGASNTTIRNELAVLRCAVKWHDPHTKATFQLPAAGPPKSQHITKKEYKKLLSVAKAPHIKLFIILAIGTAARASALLELTWKQVDFKNERINLATGDHKNKRRALVPMTDTVKAALGEAYEARTCDYVIEYGGDKIKSINIGFKRTAKKAGLEISPHVLRHSAAVWMAEARVPMEEIGQYLGHSSPLITYKVYARYSPSYLKKAASALDVG